MNVIFLISDYKRYISKRAILLNKTPKPFYLPNKRSLREELFFIASVVKWVALHASEPRKHHQHQNQNLRHVMVILLSNLDKLVA